MVHVIAICFLLSTGPDPARVPPPPDETPLVAPVTEVSIFRGSALVTRRAQAPAGGRFVVRGLSGALVADSVRLRLEGGEANGIEVRAVTATAVPEERIAALEAKLSGLRDAAAAASDDAELATAGRVRVERLLDQEAAAHAAEVAAGRDATSVWTRNFQWLDQALSSSRTAERAAAEKRDEANALVNAAAAELGGLRKDGALRTCDVAFDVVALRDGPVPLALDYLVNAASWTPRYDLRADADLKRVDVVYRAEVSQQTGEDWRDVDVWLSTAQPQLGVVGPQARTAWLSLGGRGGGRVSKFGLAQEEERMKSLGYAAADDGDGKRLDATVESEGLSVRYRLARKETIESRPGASTVLVGRAALDVTGERVCTPALDTSVWLRGRTRNTSEYVLLPGRAAVFFGNDFLGQSSIALVRPGQEFTLHLGLDPALTVTRTHLEDQASTRGFFSKKRVHVDRWKVEVENHGALAAAAPDGAVPVLVREILPKSRDDRIEVELEECTPKLATGERFERAREEQGVLTWSLLVPRHGSSEIVWKSRVEWPQDRDLDSSFGFVAPPAGSWPGFPSAPLLVGVAVAVAAFVAMKRRVVARRVLPLLVVMVAAMSAPAPAQEAVASRIERVTIFGRGAVVERTATLPRAGKFVLRDLPAAADPASVRVKIAGGEVVGVEVRERREAALPDAGVEALRAKVHDLARAVAKLDDERAALDAVLAHLQKLMSAPPAPAPAINAGGDARPGAEAWQRDQEFLDARLVAKRGEARRNAKELGAAKEALAAATRDLASGAERGVILRDVVVDAAANAAAAAGPLACEVSYLVDAAGWAPEYELRAAKDLARVVLTYRARVWQGTSEGWSDVDLWLSTAQPQRGAEGPDPRAQWLSLRSTEPAAGLSASGAKADASVRRAELDRAVAEAVAPPREPPFATVADEGLSVRFHVPDRPTLAPGAAGRSLLVGRTELPLAPRRSCVPELDPTVWLSAKATNTSDWVLLPGPSAVHFGNDYVGKGAVALTQRGQEFDVHLGPDPFVTVERVALEDLLQTSALSSKGTQSQSFRLRFENHGAPSTERDGRIVVDVQEALPRPRDERISVRLDSARPEPSSAKDDAKSRDERGILTWHLGIAAQGKAEIEWRWSAKYPEKEALTKTLE